MKKIIERKPYPGLPLSKEERVRQKFNAFTNSIRSGAPTWEIANKLEKSERLGIDKAAAAEARLTVARLAFTRQEYPAAVEHALKVLEIPFKQNNPSIEERREEAVVLIREILLNFQKIDFAQDTASKIPENISGRVENFIRKLNFEELSPVELLNWQIILSGLFPNQFIKQQLSAAERIFNLMGEQDTAQNIKEKAHIACILLLAARRIERLENIQANLSRVIKAAHYIIDHASITLADKKEWDLDIFHTFIINLVHFNLFDLAKTAVQKYQPDKQDPVLDIICIRQLLAENKTGEAYSELRLRKPSQRAGQNEILKGELDILEIDAYKRHFESNLERLDQHPLPVRLDGWQEKVLFTPGEQNRFIADKIKKLAAAALRQLAGIINYRISAIIPAEINDPFIQKCGIGPLSHVIRNTAEPDKIILYLTLGKDKYYRIAYPFTGNLAALPEKPAGAPLIWDYISVLALLDCLAKAPLMTGGNMINTENRKNELSRLVKDAAAALFISQNISVYRSLREAFSKEPYYSLFTTNISNHLLIAKKLLENCPFEIETQNYALNPADDFLHKTIKEARVLSQPDLKKELTAQCFLDPNLVGNLLRKTAPKFPFGLEITPHNSNKVLFIIKDFETVEIINPDQERLPASPFLSKCLLELALTLSIKNKFKAHLQEEKKNGKAKLLPPSITYNPEHKLAELQAIFREECRKRLEEKGIMNLDWYYFTPAGKTDGLYRPLEDQSSAGKKAAIGKLGLERLFIPTEVNGMAMRLPVRETHDKKNKSKKLESYKPNPLRAEQQKLLGENIPLKDLYVQYIVTILKIEKTGEKIIFPKVYRIFESEDEAYAATDKIQAEIDQGNYKEIEVLLSAYRGEKRAELVTLAMNSQLTIEDQFYDIFTVHQVFKRPHMESLSTFKDFIA